MSGHDEMPTPALRNGEAERASIVMHLRRQAVAWDRAAAAESSAILAAAHCGSRALLNVEAEKIARGLHLRQATFNEEVPLAPVLHMAAPERQVERLQIELNMLRDAARTVVANAQEHWPGGLPASVMVLAGLL